jgi:hypothetical protein
MGAGNGVEFLVAAVLGARQVAGIERVEKVQHKLPGQALLHDFYCCRC